MCCKSKTEATQKWLIRFPNGPQHFVFAGKTTQQTTCKNQIKQQQEPNAENANASYTLQARQKSSLSNKERIDSHILANY